MIKNYKDFQSVKKYSSMQFKQLCVELFGEKLGKEVKLFYTKNLNIVKKGQTASERRTKHLIQVKNSYDNRTIKRAIDIVIEAIEKGNTNDAETVSGGYFETVLRRLDSYIDNSKETTDKDTLVKGGIVIPIKNERIYDQFDVERFNWSYTCKKCNGEVTPWDDRCKKCDAFFEWDKVRGLE